ncbi:MAG TPA: hypothetical protein VGQ26_15700, partial [Streptosporangiaceae bacterium]|nr:hypothetical protein [Streptosporangiaceae bacterium]
PPILRGQVGIAGAAGSPGALDQDLHQPDVALAGLARAALAAGDVVASFYRERQFLAGLGIPVQLLPDHGALGRTDLRL